MPSKKTIELQDFKSDELKSELEETEKQYQKMIFDHATKGLDNPIQIREVRRDIARLHTELRKRELAEMSVEDLEGRSKKRARRARQKK